MTKDFGSQKVGELSLMDGVLITASKIGSEEILARVPMIGNGTYMSGTIKTIGALMGSMLSKDKAVKIISTGMLIDGMEDIITNFKTQSGFKFAGNGNSNNNVVVM